MFENKNQYEYVVTNEIKKKIHGRFVQILIIC